METDEGIKGAEDLNGELSLACQTLFDLIWSSGTSKDELEETRRKAYQLYDALTEEEQEDIDETMIMEHLSMMMSCYEV